MGPADSLAAIAAGAVACGVATVTIVKLRRRTPAEKERRRRLAVNSRGRLIDGLISEVRDQVVYYGYSWRGIDYDTSQDLSSLAELLPEDTDGLIGAVTVKFHPNNPYNSIVLCERWSGFPKQKLRLQPGANYETTST